MSQSKRARPPSPLSPEFNWGDDIISTTHNSVFNISPSVQSMTEKMKFEEVPESMQEEIYNFYLKKLQEKQSLLDKIQNKLDNQSTECFSLKEKKMMSQLIKPELVKIKSELAKYQCVDGWN